MTALEITRPLDQMRIAMLRHLMQNHALRKVYSDRALRLGLNYLLLFAVYLLTSLKFSIVLLIFGPLILGYPHLIASYRFLQRTPLTLQWNSAKSFQWFLVLTSVSVFIRLLLRKFYQLPDLPYGTWEILISLITLGFLKVKWNTAGHLLVVLLTLFSTVFILGFAWQYPLVFVGFALILHNWVAYGHWFLSAKTTKDKVIVFAGLILFAAAHVLIITGFFDPWISISEFTLLSTTSFQVNGWALAPWSTDSNMWDRIIVLYSFGLSLHYFIWLKAIPQNLEVNPMPNSFRRSLVLLKKDCGSIVTYFLFAAAVAGVALFVFTNQFGRIYFAVAMLHGWLELTFLLLGLYSRLLLKTS